MLAAALTLGAAHAGAQTPPNDQARLHAGGSAFAVALAREYRAYIRAERQRFTQDFWGPRFERKARLAGRGRVVPPDTPRFWRVGGAAGVALREARARLMAVFGAGARAKVPAVAAQAQVSYECWLSRTAGRFSGKTVDECRHAFFRRVNRLEDAVSPIRTTSVFNKTLAREYFAYAAFEARDQKDFIDSRYFAAKAMTAAGATAGRAPPPENLARWNLLSGHEVSGFVKWRERLVGALAVHRQSGKARIAALAQARFDCWVERTSERNDGAHVQKCRTEFFAYMRQLESRPARRGARSFAVAFRAGSSQLGPGQRRVIRAAARFAVEGNARRVRVVGHAGRAGRGGDSLRLAFRRTERIAELLRRLGVRADRIRTLHVGGAQPAVATGGRWRSGLARLSIVVIR